MTEETFISDGKLEAKVVSTTQNDKGWYIRLLLHPSDADEVTKLRYGAVLDIRWREVLNVEVEPIEVPACRVNHADYVGKCPGCHAVLPGIPKQIEHKPKERFEDMPLVKQAVLRGGDAEFRAFLASRYAAVWRECHDLGKDMDERAAIVIRRLCNVNSRADIIAGRFTGDQWLLLESEFLKWKLDQRYPAGSRR